MQRENGIVTLSKGNSELAMSEPAAPVATALASIGIVDTAINFGITKAMVAMATKKVPGTPPRTLLHPATKAAAANAADRLNMEMI